MNLALTVSRAITVVCLATTTAVGSVVLAAVTTAAVTTAAFSIVAATDADNDGLWPVGATLIALGTVAGTFVVGRVALRLRAHRTPT